MRSPAHDLAEFLQSAGLGTLGSTGRWGVYVAVEPPGPPDDCVTLSDTSGGEPDTDELDIERPGVQVRVRARSYVDAYTRAEEVKASLIMPTRITTSESTFVGVFVSVDTIFLERDENDRYVFVTSYRCIRQRS